MQETDLVPWRRLEKGLGMLKGYGCQKLWCKDARQHASL